MPSITKPQGKAAVAPDDSDKSSGKLRQVLILVGCILACGVVLWSAAAIGLFVFDQGAAARVAQEFRADVYANRLEEAYARTTKSFQRNQSLTQFSALIGQYPTADFAPTDSHC